MTLTLFLSRLDVCLLNLEHPAVNSVIIVRMFPELGSPWESIKSPLCAGSRVAPSELLTSVM